MCMSTVTWQAKSRSNPRCPTKWQKGYKVLEMNYFNGDLVPHFPYQSLTGNGDKRIELNKILIANSKTTKPKWNEKKKRIINEVVDLKICSKELDRYYLAGFHIFPIKKAAALWELCSSSRIYEVEYRKVTAEGTHKIHTHYPADCVIAQEMRVLRQLTDEEHAAIKRDNEALIA